VVADSTSSPLPPSAVRRFLEQARYVESSRQPAARSASTPRLLLQRTLRGLSRKNLAALAGFRSSGLINLLVLHLAASGVSRCPSLQIQGPQRARAGALGPNCFLLRPPSFHRYVPQGSIGLTLRDCTGESALFLSDLRGVVFLLFLAAITRLLPLSLHTRIVQFGGRTFQPRRNLPVAETHGLTPLDAQAPARRASVLDSSTRVEFFTIFSAL